MTSTRRVSIPHSVGRGARISGVGAARPLFETMGAELVAPFGKSADWLRARTGIESLRRLSAGESLLDLCLAACADALAAARISANEIDAVLVATCSGSPVGDSPLSHRLGERVAPAAVAFDVNVACSGFSYALGTADAMVRMGTARHVLVVGAEEMSSMIDPSDLGTSILFADGAGAFVVSGCDEGENGIGQIAWDSDGTQAGVLEIKPGETILRMQGPEVFRWAVDEVHKVATRAMSLAGVTGEDIDVFVPHQANLRIITAMTKRLGLDRAKIATDVTQSGNTSAASIPLAVTALQTQPDFRPGRVALLVGFGAGLAIASQVVQLP